MSKHFAFNARVIELANKHFPSAGDARNALRMAVDGISDAQLQNIRLIQVLLLT